MQMKNYFKMTFLILVVTLISLGVSSCGDDEPGLSPKDFAWMERKQTDVILDDDFTTYGNWQYVYGSLATNPGYLTLTSPNATTGAYAYNRADLDDKNWQIEATINPLVLKGGFSLRWEKDPLVENYYELALNASTGKFTVKRTGISSVFGAQSPEMSVSTLAINSPLIFTIRRVDDKIYFFENHQLKLTRNYEKGYGTEMSMRVSELGSIKIDSVDVAKIK